MLYRQITAKTLAEGVEKALSELYYNGNTYKGENQDREDYVKEISLALSIVEPLSEPMISKCMPSGIRGLMEYNEEFLNGTRDFETCWEYTYHKLYAPYYDRLIDELRRNSGTRRACINLGGEINFSNPHPPCLQLLDFNIRDGKLNMTAFFRSNDAVKASAMNMFVLVMLLKQTADILGAGAGVYTHIAESYHAYSEDWGTLENYIALFKEKPLEKRIYHFSEFLRSQEKYRDEYYKMIEERKKEISGRK